jgi:PAS domain-containing protein
MLADRSPRWIRSQREVKNSANGEPERAIGIMVDDSEVHELAQTLDDTSARLKTAMELGQIALWRYELATGWVQYDNQARLVLDVPPDQTRISVEEMHERTHPDDLERVIAAAQQALRNHAPSDVESRFRSRDGRWRTVLSRRVVERKPDGTPFALVGIMLDVTEQAEERRRATESLRRVEYAVAAAGVGIWSYDIASGKSQWNDSMYALKGQSPALGPPTPAE